MRWLFDEMFPPACAERLAGLGHDALSVHDLGLAGHGDDEVLSAAVGHDRILVTENFGDFSALLDQRLSHGEACVPVVFVRRDRLPRRGALAAKVAELLSEWARANPEPYVGPHWPKWAAAE